MIPRANITAWRKAAPWPDNAQVEQDLVLSRALVERFGRPAFADNAAFRGGTALHKLFFDPVGSWLFETGTFAPMAKFEDEKRPSIVSNHLGS